MNKHLFIRADASTQSGTGHVMRCLALAQAWQDDKGDVFFVMATESSALETRLRSEGMEIAHLSVRPGSINDAIETANLAQEVGAAWVVVDGYHFDANYQRVIKDSGARLLYIDDNGQADYYHADIVLNQNINAHESLYENREPFTRLLLGTRYALLRREFLEWKEWKREIPDVAHKVLITLGGGDPDNVTLRIIKAINSIALEGLEIKTVVGPSNPNMASLKGAIHHSPFTIPLLSAVRNMPKLMAWADVAISAGGSTCWELAFMGVPALTVVTAGNQWKVAEGLDKGGIFKTLGWWEHFDEDELAKELTALMMDPESRREKNQLGQQLVTGHGVDSLIKIILNGRLTP